ncbi:hypothetical protein K5L04_09675 [Flavobacterium psychrophilum]|uniref:hypothetical protein n=1 Tax=Flavobacterium psychrophilum TaxID=96345 RepID=UPI001C8F6D0C|nr:hypothetical protein [Flavobacterium psychrophilum]QZK99963.1 hypothetical protein K5L04_09675 [Flavobacterium psychrophilum]
MIKTIVAYDDNDSGLGDYFNCSFLYIDSLKNQSNTSITGVNGLNCTESNINQIIPQHNTQNFVFVALSHGSDDGMCLVGGDNYVNQNNSNLFINSFFYSTACHVGKKLGNILFDNNCKSFIGYTDEAKAPNSGDFVNLFIECELYALKNFFLTTKTIEVLFDEMKLFIDDKFLELANGTNIIEAMALLDNKNCMVLIANENNKLLTKSDFDV